jgi:GTP-binding protein HflX
MKSLEKVLLVIVQLKTERNQWSTDDLMIEMQELVSACHGEVIDKISCRLEQVNAGLFLGEGKVKEIAELCKAKEVNTVIINRDLKGSQQRNLEEEIGKKIIDRTQLILDIFARRAKSQEGKMQVELAQLEYLLPRLVGHGVELSRLGGGIGTMGPGETKLEMDRRRIHERIDRLHKDLKDVSSDRMLRRKKRQDDGVPLVSLVGYTKGPHVSTETRRAGLILAGNPHQRQILHFTFLCAMYRRALCCNAKFGIKVENFEEFAWWAKS